MKKIAVAVKDTGKKVEHFGICEYFLVYNYNLSLLILAIFFSNVFG